MKASVENKINIGFAISFLALAGMGWLSYRATQNFIVTDNWVSHTHKVIATLESGLAILIDAETSQRGYLLTGDERFLQDCKNDQTQVKDWTEELRNLTADNPQQQQRLNKLESDISQRMVVLNNRIQLRQQQGLQAAADAVKLREGKNLMDQVWRDISEMRGAENQLLVERQSVARANAKTSLIVIISGSAVACAISLAAFFLVRHDLKLRAQTQETLQQSEERARLMTESIKDYAIIMLDPDGRVVSWNDGAEQIKGYTAKEIIGQHFSRFYPPDAIQIDFPKKELERATANGRFEDTNWRVRKDGSRFWANVVITPVRDQNGELLGFVKVTRDLTEQRRSEEKIQKLNEDLKQRAAQLEIANKELEAFSYSVSHDLRAPLRHIDGFVKLLDKQAAAKLDASGQRYLHIIADSARQMGALIDDLLVFSRMSRTELRRTKVALNSLLDEAVNTLQTDINGRHINWKIGALPEVKADPAMLRQVWVNLIANAVKYTRPRDPAEIEVGCADKNNGEFILFVRDNGVGFDMKYVDKLFGVFQRLHRSEEFEGTGIGLANVQRIISRHGGRAWAEGKTGEGATFFFSLPKNQTETKV